MRSLDEITPGLVLGGHYECLLPIARGGQASVWAARVNGARGFEKTVAIKTILPTLTQNSNVERMFLDEARVASSIRHPNVVEILELGEEGALLYLVMEYVEGEQLLLVIDALRKRGPMPLALGVKIVMDVCSGLHAAHELKQNGRPLELVHRDISPQNIMISLQGHVKLVDFGVAKMNIRLAEETADGFIKGKTSYLAPEQVVDKSLDRRTDLFALGTILYEITTGTHPFRVDSDGATLHNILRRKIKRPSELREDYPPQLEAVVMRALEREPEFRFQTALDMYKALDAAIPHEQRATAEDLAAFVQPIIGPRVERFLADLAAAAQRHPPPDNSKRGITPTGEGKPDISPAEPSVVPSRQPVESQTGSSLPVAPVHERRRTSALVAFAIFASVVALVGGFALRRAVRSSPPDTAAMPSGLSATSTAAFSPLEPASSAGPESSQSCASASASAEPPSSAAPQASASATASAAPAHTASHRGPSTAPATKKSKTTGGKKWTPPVSESGL